MLRSSIGRGPLSRMIGSTLPLVAPNLSGAGDAVSGPHRLSCFCRESTGVNFSFEGDPAPAAIKNVMIRQEYGRIIVAVYVISYGTVFHQQITIEPPSATETAGALAPGTGPDQCIGRALLSQSAFYLDLFGAADGFPIIPMHLHSQLGIARAAEHLLQPDRHTSDIPV